MATYISEVEAIQFTGSNFEECKAWFEENIKEGKTALCEDDNEHIWAVSESTDTYIEKEEYLISWGGKLMTMYPEDFERLFKPKS